MHRLANLLALCLVLAGCIGTPPSSPAPALDLPSAAQLVDDFHPRQVNLIEIQLNVTVNEPFDTSYHRQSYRARSFDLIHTDSGTTLVSKSARTIWLVQDNDTIVIGRYH